MKKIITIVLLIGIIIVSINNKNISQDKTESIEEFRGVFVSYIEISKYLKDKDEETSKKNIESIVKNVKKLKLNTIILQVRPSSDAMYYSKIFPISKYLSDDEKYPYDILEYFIKISHESNIKLIAWINPYRVSTTSNNINEITKKNPAYKYINTDTLYINNGIFYNPSKKEIETLIVDGVKEILDYAVDGVLFDDYFYPSNDIDIKDYEEYQKKNNTTIEEYHLNVVNNMIKKVHTECRKKKIVFGVSPEGNIENNYQKNFADIKTWLKESNYVDFIMPQIYYGFTNQNKPFINTINEWSKLIKNKNISFIPALAIYKSNKIDEYALSGKDEWITNNDIIMKEIIISRNLSNYSGFSLYRYDSLFENDKKKELKNVNKILK